MLIRPMTTPVTPDFGSDSEDSSQRVIGKGRGIRRRLTFPFTPPHLMYSKKSRRLDYCETSLSPSLFFPEIPSPDDLIEDSEQARENNTFRLYQRMNRIFIPRLEKQEDYEFQSVDSLHQPKPVTTMRGVSARDLGFPPLEKVPIDTSGQFPSVRLQPRKMKQKCLSMDDMSLVES